MCLVCDCARLANNGSKKTTPMLEKGNKMEKPTRTKFTLERHYKLYDNGTGQYISIGDDCDGSDVCEINQGEQKIFVRQEEIPLFIKAMEDWLSSKNS
jgi:hypothetical protein